MTKECVLKTAKATAAPQPSASVATTAKAALSIDEWCAAYGFSRASFYNFSAAGIGPKFFRAGKSVRISLQAAQEWLAAREEATAGAPGKAGKHAGTPAPVRS